MDANSEPPLQFHGRVFHGGGNIRDTGGVGRSVAAAANTLQLCISCDRLTDIQTNGQTDRQTNEQTDGQTDRRMADRQTNRQTDRQTDK